MAAAGGMAVFAVLGALLLAFAGTASAQSPPPTNQQDSPLQPGDPVCVRCHAFVSNDVVSSWRSQNHGRAQVACPVCHGTHEKEFRPNPKASLCLGCHDLARTHPDLAGASDSPAGRCMDCHTANVHLLPGQESWFQGGLPLTKLTAPPAPAGSVAPGTARTTALVVVVGSLLLGLAVGLVYVALARKL